MGVWDILWRCALTMIAGWFLGFLATRSALKAKYSAEKPEPEGILRLAYDQDDPNHPAMGLEIESLNYILTHDTVTLVIEKKGFPNPSDRVILESRKGNGA